jgi:hypothetical protein
MNGSDLAKIGREDENYVVMTSNAGEIKGSLVQVLVCLLRHMNQGMLSVYSATVQFERDINAVIASERR